MHTTVPEDQLLPPGTETEARDSPMRDNLLDGGETSLFSGHLYLMA